MKITVIFKNRETQEEETSEITILPEDIASLYKDQFGTFIVMRNGKSYKVTQKFSELEAELCL